jgi:CheY-like chemotaxis protein/GGDEF domain-containing protein
MHRTSFVTGNARWRVEVREWCAEFRRFLAGPWREHEASELFERIEAFSSLADLIADPVVADATAELAVYLCAFADSQLHPDGGQVRRLDRLAEELEQTLSQAATEAATPARQAGAALFRVLYLRAPGEHRPELVAALEQERIQAFSADALDEALVALDHSLPDAVVLHANFVNDVRRLAQPGRHHGAATWRRVLWAADSMEDDVRTRLHARRAGIDLLLDDDPDEAARSLLSALLRRREEGYRVLVVEDDRGHAMFVESLLRHQGFEVDVAGSAEEALELMQSHAPDLMLLDINLPDMSGIELTQLVRERTSLAHVPIVFLTGEEDLDKRAEAIAVGGDDFLSKPVRPRHLLANVNSRIGRARALSMSAPAERPEDGLTQRLDRVRFVEAMEQLRTEHPGCAGVAAYVLDDVARVAGGLGFVQAGNLALQFAQAIEAECGGLGRTCGIGEFSRLVLMQDRNADALRQRADALRSQLSSRGWLESAHPLRLSFSVGLARFDGASIDGDAVIANAISQAEGARRAGGGRMAFDDVR